MRYIAVEDNVAAAIHAAIENSTASPSGAPATGMPAQGAPPAPSSGSWTSPVTGHVLPVPQAVEGLPSYALRVAAEAGVSAERATQMNGVFMAGTANFHMAGDGSRQYWPGIVDEGYNREAYQTPAEKAEFAAAQKNVADQMNAVKPGPYPAATANLADANFLLAVDPYYRAHVNGRSVWQDSLGGTQVEINRVIGMTGGGAVDWPAKMAYTGPLVGIVDKLIAGGGVWTA